MCFIDQTIFTAGEDGMVRSWRLPDAEAEAKVGGMEEAQVGDEVRDGKARKKREKGKHEEGKRARFQPY